jgi:hypothetical protein
MRPEREGFSKCATVFTDAQAKLVWSAKLPSSEWSSQEEAVTTAHVARSENLPRAYYGWPD